MKELIKVVIGFDQRESVAYHTFCQSIIQRTSTPVSFIPVLTNTLQGYKVMALTGNIINMSHLSSATYIVKALDKVENEEVSYKVVKN